MEDHDEMKSSVHQLYGLPNGPVIVDIVQPEVPEQLVGPHGLIRPPAGHLKPPLETGYVEVGV